MGYNIVKIMTNKEGKSIHVLLTDGLSEILEVKELKQALKTIEIFNQNTDSGWRYEVRSSPCQTNGKK
jgi:serine/threonine protein phosphatase PrpC|tara:strand:+ start:753 stop:956 length:204 start_codon:yes stop_codon:yes gene_type:complete